MAQRPQKVKYFFLQRSLFFSCLFFIFLFFHPAAAAAASLFFAPSSGIYSVDKTLSVNVEVATGEQVINAASGVINFPQNKLEVISLSKSNSIFNLWVQEPSFSNGAGTINFEGIILNPGFHGQSGRILTINFKIKDLGPADLYFQSGSILANDGQGTNILTNLGSAGFTLGNPLTEVVPISSIKQAELNPVTPLTEKLVETLIVGAPIISSPTHPDQTKWYNNNNPKISWSDRKSVV
jgi:hypothetical protein